MVLGRRGLTRLDLGGGHRQRLSFRQSVRPCPHLRVRRLRVHLPAGGQDFLPFGGVRVPSTQRRDAGLRRAARRADGPEQAQRHQPQYLTLPNGQGLQVRPARAGRGHHGIVVADPGAVADLSGQHRLRRGHTADAGSRLDQRRDARLHIVRQIPAVCPGVSRELFVVEGL